jgi:hypothetical protein
MLNKALLSSLLIAASTSVCYGWGMPTLPSVGGVGSMLSGGSAASSSAGSADVDTFVAQGKLSSQLITDSTLRLAMAVATKENRDKLKQTQEQLKKGLATGDKTTTDTSTALSKDAQTVLNESLDDSASADRIKSLSDEQKTIMKNSLYNYSLGIQQQLIQVGTGQQIIAHLASNMGQIAKMGDVKNTVAEMGSNIKASGVYLTKIPALFKTANIVPVLPTDASSKPKDAGAEFN